MKSLIVIFAILIVGIIFIVVWDHSSKPTIDQTNYNEISWRLPLDKEIKKMEKSFLQSGINLCTTYFIKKYKGEKYLIACDSGSGTWTYYTAYATEHKVYRTSGDFTSSLVPPENLVQQSTSNDDLLKQDTKTSGKTGSSLETIHAK